MVPIGKVNLRYAKYMSISYEISWGIQKWSYPMKAEVKAEWNFQQSFIKSSKIGNRYS